jgi:hypothetical protein
LEKKMMRAERKLVLTDLKNIAKVTYACGTGGASVGGERGTGWREK